MSGYTVAELEQETGFSRRTIAYYVQLGLLPRVGRMGPKTRYPEQVRDRLHFIRRVREAQEAGEVPPVSLSDIAEVFERAPARLISRVANGRARVAPEIISSPASPGSLPSASRLPAPSRRRAALEERLEERRGERPGDRLGVGPGERLEVREAGDEARRYSSRRVREAMREQFERYAAESPRSAPPSPGAPRAHDLAVLLARLERSAGLLDGPRSSSGAVDTWSRVAITPGIALSVRGLPEEEAELLEAAGRRLRRLIRRGQDSMS